MKFNQISRFSGIALLLCVLIAMLSCLRDLPTENNDSQYTVHLIGKVLTKDGAPVPYALAKLQKYRIQDTTDSKGMYELIVKDSGMAKLVADSTDTLQILRDGQLITAIEILSLIDTLPDVLIVQRDITGKIDSSVTSFKRVEAVIWNFADSNAKNVELFYSKPTYSYSGFIYFVYTGSTQNYKVYVNAYNQDSVFIGRSDTVGFSSIAGNIKIPLLTCNALPRATADGDTSVSINDTIRLQGSAYDAYGGHIVKWEWDDGNTGNFIETTPDSNYSVKAPFVFYNNREYVLRVTDDDGNVGLDTIVVHVLKDDPVPVATGDTTVNINDTIHLRGTASDVYGRIVKWEWDIGNTGTFVETTPDSNCSGKAPSVPNYHSPCILRVTDDDNNQTLDTVILKVFERNFG
jgi:hypothetical protein